MAVLQRSKNHIFGLNADLIASRLALAFAELCWAIMLFWPFEREHCRKAYLSELRGAHLPPEYQEVKQTKGTKHG